MALTVKGASHFLSRARGVANPTNYKIVLITNAATPTRTTSTFSGLTEIAAGNGYTSGGMTIALNSTDFDQLVEDTTTNFRAELHMKDLVWTASGGTIPASGVGIYTAVLADDNATLNSREVYAFWTSTAAPHVIANGLTFTLPDLTIAIECSV